MTGTSNMRFAQVAVLIVVALLASLAGMETSDAASARGKCAKSNALPGEATASELAEAVECLIGKERRKADVKPVESNGDLGRVAAKHADVMLEQNCLDHRCKGESSLDDRIVRSGYPHPGGRYGFAEVTGCALTPAAMVDAWMSSRVHRKRILGKSYRDIGTGVVKGSIDVSGCDDGGRRGVYAVIFGWRSR